MNTKLDVVQVLRTGAMPSSESLGPRFSIHDLSETAADIPPHIALSTRAIIAAGPREISDALMAQLPNLGIVANFGVGYDRVDVAAATRRGIVVANTPDVLTDEVADFTLGLLIATSRRFTAADAFVRSGAWSAAEFPLTASLRGRQVGIVGMGRIGAAIARRVAAMGLPVSYCSRTPKPELTYNYVSDLTALAERCDVLIVIVPASAETERLIDASVIKALGPNGILINVARGSVIDEPALIAALTSNQLLAAGLDVFPDEPRVSPELIALPNVVLTPHIGSGTLTTRNAMGNLVLANIRNWCEGKAPLTPVNEVATRFEPTT